MVSKQTSEDPRLLLNGVLQYASDRFGKPATRRTLPSFFIPPSKGRKEGTLRSVEGLGQVNDLLSY